MSGSREPGDDLGDDTETGTYTLSMMPTATLWSTAPAGLPMPDRYVDLGFLGSGAMGEVRRVRDTRLGALVAMKLLRKEGREVDAVRSRFEAEAQLTAQLRHPNIVAVHDSGVLPDGRVWFTMELVEGRTLDAVIRSVHAACGPHTWRTTRDGWSLRRLLGVLAQVCEAVGFAHARGVVHLDLKPRNVMVGPHGEVKVMDWGIARGAGFDLAAEATAVEALPSQHRTVAGSVVGTPAYMSPEQASGHRSRLGPPSDVYSLGALLFHVLAGRPPHEGRARTIVRRVREQGAPPLDEVRGRPAPAIPPGLRPLLDRCLRQDPYERFPDAGALARALSDWLAADARRDEALDHVRQARARQGDIHRLRSNAISLEQAAANTLNVLPLDAPIESKQVGWDLQQMAREKRVALAKVQAEVEERLWAALSIAPGLPEARAALADIQRERLLEAEQVQDADAALEREAWLRELDDGAHDAFLDGTGAISLESEPSGATVVLHRLVERDRVLQPVRERVLGTTPLEQAPLGRGEWLVVLEREGSSPVRLPIRLERQQHWENRGPDGLVHPILLPSVDELRPDEVYVPAGWAVVGGVEGEGALPRRRVWCEGFVIARDPVTFGAWAAFLQDLVDRGELDEARARSRPALHGTPPLVPEAGDRAWARLPDRLARCPVQRVSLTDALAFLRWRSERDGVAWRLPSEVEWEKAARGTGGRRLPWGRHLDPALAHIEGSVADPDDHPVGTWASDVSPYGVRDLGGGVSDLTGTPFRGPPSLLDASSPESPPRDVALTVKGGRATLRGSWVLPEARHDLPPHSRTMFVGLRPARTWPTTDAVSSLVGFGR